MDKSSIDTEDINKKDEEGRTVLHRAVLQNNETLVEYILKQDELDINAIDRKGNSPLFYACTNGNSRVAHALKFEGATLVAYASTVAEALVQNGKIGDLSSIKLFHKSGADMRERMEDGQNVATASATYGQYNTLMYLAKYCDVSIFVDVKTQEIEPLVESIADPNVQQTVRQILNARLNEAKKETK